MENYPGHFNLDGRCYDWNKWLFDHPKLADFIKISTVKEKPIVKNESKKRTRGDDITRLIVKYVKRCLENNDRPSMGDCWDFVSASELTFGGDDHIKWEYPNGKWGEVNRKRFSDRFNRALKNRNNK